MTSCFRIELIKQQHVICGTERAVQQARWGKDDAHVFATSGM